MMFEVPVSPIDLRSCFLSILAMTMLSAGGAAEPARSHDVPVEGAAYYLSEVKLELIWVDAGSFLMGSSATEADRDEAEGPQTQVTLSHGFWLGETAQYEALIGENPSAFKEAGPNAPVEHVSWILAMDYCELLTDREMAAGRLPEGYEYTLPTEAEWEYVYRAGTTGDYVGSLAAMGWIESNSGGITHPVAQKQQHPWGFYGLTGNVLEWCYDWYSRYPGGKVTDPTGPRIARGACWRMDGAVARSAARAGGSAARVDYTLGFRIALHRER